VTTGLAADHPDNPPIGDVAGLITSVDADAHIRAADVRRRARDGGGDGATRIVSTTAGVVRGSRADLRVHVEARSTPQGRLVATAVHIAPDRPVEFGVVSNLGTTAGTFTLQRPLDPATVQFDADTLVLFHGHALTTADLANGQVVRIGGSFDATGVLHARVIRIRGDRFAGVVTSITAARRTTRSP
jgi:hypothetical protein